MEQNRKRIKITPILFNNGENLASEFIAFCPPILRIKIFKCYPTEYIIIKEFHEIFKYNDVYYGFCNDKAYLYGRNEIQAKFPWNYYRDVSLKEIRNCYGKKIFIILKSYYEDCILTVIRENQSVFTFTRMRPFIFFYQQVKVAPQTTCFSVKNVKCIRFENNQEICGTEGICLTQEIYYFSSRKMEKLPIKNVLQIGTFDYPSFYFKTNDEPEKIQEFDLQDESTSLCVNNDNWFNGIAFPTQNLCILGKKVGKKGIYYSDQNEKTVEFF